MGLHEEGIYRNPDGIPDQTMIQRDFDAMTKLDFIKQHLDVKPYLDLSLVKEADQRLK